MIQPTSNRVMVRPIREDRMSPSGALFLLPEETTFTHGRWDKELANTKGEVLAVGPKVREVQIGDVVRYSDSCGHLLMVEGVETRFIRDDDVSCVL